MNGGRLYLYIYICIYHNEYTWLSQGRRQNEFITVVTAMILLTGVSCPSTKCNLSWDWKHAISFPDDSDDVDESKDNDDNVDHEKEEDGDDDSDDDNDDVLKL